MEEGGYVVLAGLIKEFVPSNEQLIIKADENSAVRWIPLNKIDVYSNEPHMKRIYNKIIDKIEAK